MNEAKPFCISKKEVWGTHRRVQANKGAAGVDDKSIEDFEKKFKATMRTQILHAAASLVADSDPLQGPITILSGSADAIPERSTFHNSIQSGKR
jgi:hypothetical protein